MPEWPLFIFFLARSDFLLLPKCWKTPINYAWQTENNMFFL